MNINHASLRGQVILLALVFFATVFTITSALFTRTISYVTSERHNIASSQALALAEAGIEESAYQLNQGTYSGETNTVLGNGTFTTTVSTVDASTKIVTSTGSVVDGGTTVTKTVKTTLGINSDVVSFRYGVQTGSGGFVMSGGSTINGSVYSNGDISATSGVVITGSATAANPPALFADQVNATPVPITSCTASTCVTFGNAGATQDFAQSFTISTAEVMDSIQFYIKKVGAPSDATVRIVTDSAGSPSTTVLMTGTLAASSVTTSFGWVTVTLPSTPVLDPSQTYWMVLDSGSSASKYYIIGANSGGYANGVAKIGQYSGAWSNTTPTGLDGYFQLFLGGGTSVIGGSTSVTGVYVGTTASDDAWAHTVQGATVSGSLYCATGSYTSKACNISKSDPTPQPMPISDGTLQDWKDDALAGGTIVGNYTVGSGGATLGPKKIVGDLLINGGGQLNITGTLWVTGNITVTSGGKARLDPSFGTKSGTIVADGYVILAGGSSFAGSGTAGSYPFLVTTSACPAAAGCAGNNAISLSGGAGTVALTAQNGTVSINGGTALKAVTAKQIIMSGGATLDYDSGLINANFSSGPGGSWGVVPGTYAITD